VNHHAATLAVMLHEQSIYLNLAGKGQTLASAMSHTAQIVLNSILSLLGLGFLVWVSVRTLRRSGDPMKLIFKWVFTIPFVLGCLYVAAHLGPFGPFLIVFMAIILSVMWTSHISEALFSPLTNMFDGGHEEPEKKPYYSAVKAKRNRGHPLEALVAVREQLAKFPNDFEGVLLLANIQAEDLNDLPGAEITLNNFCNSPRAPDRQVVAALTQLADWHLKKTVDVDAARAALQKIVDRFPDTEIALRAEQRLAHLGGVEKIMLEQHDRQATVVPEGVNNIGLLDSTTFLQPKEIEPGKLAAVYVKHLEQHPHDSEVREKLAVIYARDFQRLDLATLELAQLINEPRHSAKQIAGWLNQLANFQVELGADTETVMATLGKIVEQFPDLPVADLARRRLERVKLEIKGQQKMTGVKLGVYEQNIGLKYGSPRKQ
jgi:tetratricopeptide (TPR) repeat protein